ncbi:MAG: 50S ribosomal protein L11 methyltransferase [Ruminococcaceae bacterium]|nr:50S ribosomal protein L11 methyltransferase [Oscillospiraceae bacterium]
MDQDYVCGDYGTVSDWTQIRVTVKLEELDRLTAVMSMVSNNLQIEDYSDIDLKTCYGDLIDESILNADKTVASVSVYIPSDRSVAECMAFLKERFEASGLSPIKTETVGVNEEDWANSWKAYYKPLRIGERLVIVPAWESFDAAPEDLVVRMDPGMAFGTGTHETTRLVIGMLERYTKKGCRMLDVGTGSGILAICASKLGAGECFAYDIDPMAVRVANENIRDSGLNNIVCEVSDLLKQADRSRPYDLICANLVADIIIRMIPELSPFMDENTVLLASGIITQRSQDVVDCFEAYGYRVVEAPVENDWCALAVMKK